ncbi:MAG: GntR family transcriptional regulator [Pseudomonadota bacterium]|nr:GntR family transcriptional regulator [Pseudomonadota bacterium]
MAPGLRRAASSGPEAENRVVVSVTNAIREFRLRPGARLVEREIALNSGASRSAVRNGLLRLAQSGLVELSPNRGATIATCSPKEARDVFEARRVVETAVIRRLVQMATPELIARLLSLVEDERQAYGARRIAQARQLSREFHLLLAELADNAALTGFLKDLIEKQPLLSWSDERGRACFCGNAAHAGIVAAIACADADAAVERNARHLDELEHMLIVEREAGAAAFAAAPKGAAP